MPSIFDLELSLNCLDASSCQVDFRFSQPANYADIGLGPQKASAAFDLEKLSTLEYEPAEYAAELTRSLFQSEALRTVFAQARAVSQQAGAALRLRFAIAASAPELRALRWELLNDPASNTSLSTDQNVYFSRYLSSLDWRPVRLRSKGELKALAVIAAPAGLEAYKLADVDKPAETATIAAGLGEIRLKTLERATLNGLVSALTAEEFDILYLVAHGIFASGEAWLWLEDDAGQVARVSGAELVNRLRELEHRPRLVVLASCQSAGKGAGEVLSALGPRLAEIGIPAVLAMQGNLRMETNAKFMPRFFAELQKDGQIDRALSVARGLVREQPDWWAPALFMRLKDGQMWEVQETAQGQMAFGKVPALLQGIERLPVKVNQNQTVYQGMRDFLVAYLGTNSRPVPFGGREDALDRIDAWLAETKPSLLLTAQAGQGKSALLVRWLDNLKARDDLALVFVPISIRFDTNREAAFYAALAARLAFLHGEAAPTQPETSTAAYRELVWHYLARPLAGEKTLLLVLDGLDEAADWQVSKDFLPGDLPAWVRVVVSARGENAEWRSKLNWESSKFTQAFSLKPLTRKGVADVLRQMGCPLDELSHKVDLVAELYRLSEGDPLLVSLYVDDLWAKGEDVKRLKPEDLADIPPGLEGYFKRWWKYQEILWGSETPLFRPHVQTLFNLLAGAFSGLTREDLVSLAPQELNSHILGDALKALERFIIGDGINRGYAFSHPRLGQYFWGLLTVSEREQVERRFLVWGEKTLQELLNGQRSTQEKDTFPVYVVRNYAAHLARTKQPLEKWLPLIHHQQWAQAWFTVDGAYGGYLQDVRRVWERCQARDRLALEKGEPAPRLGEQLRCALIEASVSSLSQGIPAELVTALIKHRVWSPAQGLAYIRYYELEKRVNAVIQVLPYLEDWGEQALRDLLQDIGKVTDEYSAKGMLLALAPRLPETLQAEALVIIENFESGYFDPRDEVLWAFAPHLDAEPSISKALDILAATSGVSEAKVKTLMRLLPKLSLPQQQVFIKNNPVFAPEYACVLALEEVATSPTRIQRALQFVLQVTDDSQRRAHLMEYLSPKLNQELVAQVFEPAMLQDRRLIIAIFPWLEEPQQKDFIQSLSELYPIDYRTKYVIALKPLIPEKEFERLVGEMLDSRWDTKKYIRFMEWIAPFLNRTLQEKLLQIFAHEVEIDQRNRKRGFGGKRDESNDAFMLEQWYLASIIIALAPTLPDDLLERALSLTQHIERHSHYHNAMRALIPNLKLDLLKQAMMYLEKTQPGNPELAQEARWTLYVLVRRWCVFSLTEAQEIIQEKLKDVAAYADWIVAWMEIALAQVCEAKQQEELLQMILQKIGKLMWALEAAKDLTKRVAPLLETPELLQQALTLAQNIGDYSDCNTAQRKLEDFITPEESGKTETASEIQKAEILFSAEQIGLVLNGRLSAPRLDTANLPRDGEALLNLFSEADKRIHQLIEEQSAKNWGIDWLGPIDFDGPSGNIFFARIASQNRAKEKLRQKAAQILAKTLDFKIIQQAYETVTHLEHENRQDAWFEWLTRVSPAELQVKLFQFSLSDFWGEDICRAQAKALDTDAVTSLFNTYFMGSSTDEQLIIRHYGFYEDKILFVLELLAPRLNEQQLSIALDFTFQHTRDQATGEALTVLSPYLHPVQLEHAAKALVSWDGYEVYGYTCGISAIAHYLDARSTLNAMKHTFGIQRQSDTGMRDRVTELTALAKNSHLTASAELDTILVEGLHAIIAQQPERKLFVNDIVALAPLLYLLGGEQAIRAAQESIQDVTTWWP